MNKYILEIKGMRCGMCEMHIEDAIRKLINVKKVKASHLKNNLIVITDLELSSEFFQSAIKPTGYELVSIKQEVAKKTLLGWK